MADFLMSKLRANVLAARERLTEGCQRLAVRHRDGAAGLDIARAMTDLRDEVIAGLFHSALAHVDSHNSGSLGDNVALVAHGGYGRRDVAPYSDVDLMILCSPNAVEAVEPLAQRWMRDVFDVGIALGHSVRTPDEACRLAIQDATICTSLIESRLLVGSESLFSGFEKKFRSLIQSRVSGLLGARRAMTKSRSAPASYRPLRIPESPPGLSLVLVAHTSTRLTSRSMMSSLSLSLH